MEILGSGAAVPPTKFTHEAKENAYINLSIMQPSICI